MLTNFNRDLELADGLESNNLKLLYYDLSPMSSDYKSYEYSRLCTIIEGCKHVSVNKDINFTYEPGQFILLPPHTNIHLGIDAPTKALVFELNNNLLKKVTEKISIDIDANYESLVEDRFFRGNIQGELDTCLKKLYSISAKPNKNKEFLLDLYGQELVYYLVQIKGIQQVIKFEDNNPIHKSINYIQDNIRQPICIKQLAYDLNMSEANFCNSFKKLIGVTPREYITNLKLTQAKNMLKNQNVTEVALDLGYENISHFIEIFKNKYGITPKQYKSIGEVPVIYH
ncbi:helix-turn-helix transcriptional regulator [Desulfitobacterium sp. AusDCA]|uniref:helix-turn-helix transcriptional regulator n=1 Tax=Desulfitobacterium sp. AusDCA TaxID=3240383 RepID=UPI003DA775B4